LGYVHPTRKADLTASYSYRLAPVDQFREPLEPPVILKNLEKRMLRNLEATPGLRVRKRWFISKSEGTLTLLEGVLIRHQDSGDVSASFELIRFRRNQKQEWRRIRHVERY